MNDREIKKILEDSKTIAMVGISSEKKGEDPKNLKRKPANIVMKYMQDFGYKVIPVNPFAEGEVINGEKVLSSLDKISETIDIVDVFRPSKEAPGIAKEIVGKNPNISISKTGEIKKIIDLMKQGFHRAHKVNDIEYIYYYDRWDKVNHKMQRTDTSIKVSLNL